MPIFKNGPGRELARKAKAYIGQGVGATQALRRLGRQEQELAALRAMLASRESSSQDTTTLNPKNVLWVFGSGRTGSSWLTFMMGSLETRGM
jgi:hypothetical protein